MFFHANQKRMILIQENRVFLDNKTVWFKSNWNDLFLISCKYLHVINHAWLHRKKAFKLAQ